jgi:polyketide-type polyunsaturated fatty acid synthase PfaA
VPKTHWLIEDYYDPTAQGKTKTYAKRGGFVPEVNFDPLEYGMLPKAISSTDTSQLLALLVANQVLEDACSFQFKTVDRQKTSVILGVASGTELLTQMAAKIQEPVWQKVLRECGIPENKAQEIFDKVFESYVDWDEGTFPGLLGNVVAGRIANRLDLGGTNCIVDAACASSLAAIEMAVHELQLGYSDLVITGGVDAFNDIFMYMCFTKTPALSMTGDCRPFSINADGTLLGEGVGMLALRRLKDAERDGDQIYAVIRGIGTSSDGKGKSVYAPNSDGQARAIINAYKKAGYGFDEVELMEAHGTATLAGDVAEFAGLVKAKEQFGANIKPYCALGSVKSQIGHTKAAAGTASLIKTIMALHHKVYPPTIKVEKPNPKLDIANSSFYLNTMARPWIHSKISTRKAGVSSFGFGGSNFHATLEEYQGAGVKPKRILNSPVQLLLFSADTLEGLKRSMEESMISSGRTEIELLARKLQHQFYKGAKHRLAVIIGKDEELATVLKKAISSLRDNPGFMFEVPGKIYYSTGKLNGKIAFLFPGQGSQYVNMGADIALTFNVARETWDLVAAVDLNGNNKLHEIVFPAPVFSDDERMAQTEALKRTEWAQPALGTVSVAILNVLSMIGIKADYFAGHSYGELTALFAGGVFENVSDFIKVSRKRGELMSAASSLEGGMTAVMAACKEVSDLLDQSMTNVCIANINSPKQTVISGETSELAKVEGLLGEKGFIFQRLPVATAFHSKLVEKSVEPFYRYLQNYQYNKNSQTVLSNTTGDFYNDQDIKETLAGQLAKPVLFQQQIERLYENGVRIFIEVGAGSVLTKLVGDCLKNNEHVAFSLDKKGSNGLTSLWSALGKLSVAGVKILYGKLWEEFLEPQTDHTKKFSPATVKINGANYGKPYPSASVATRSIKPVTKLNMPQEGKVKRQKSAETPILIQVHSKDKTEGSLPVDTSRNQGESRDGLVPVENIKPGIGVLHSNAKFVDERLRAFQLIQQNTFEAQKMFQLTLAESHMRFLDASSEALRQLSKLSGANPLVIETNTPSYTESVFNTGVEDSFQRTDSEYSKEREEDKTVIQKTISEEGHATENNFRHIPRPPVLNSFEPINAPSYVIENIPHSVAKSNLAVDYKQLLLEIVADKTGFPKEIIDLNMEMESELGIDSIKRVEILSALQVKEPKLKNLDTGKLATTRTLQEILNYVHESNLEESQSDIKKN